MHNTSRFPPPLPTRIGLKEIMLTLLALTFLCTFIAPWTVVVMPIGGKLMANAGLCVVTAIIIALARI